jgi:S-adenosylmethionine:tRNA ribosyltransferase-isomerase
MIVEDAGRPDRRDEAESTVLSPQSPSKDDAAIPPAFRLSTYQFPLPPELIAQRPAARRDESRLLALDRKTGGISHHRFKDLPSLLQPSDVLVINETKVMPALLLGRKPSGGKVELLVLGPAPILDGESSYDPAVRVCMYRSSKRLRRGATIEIPGGTTLLVEETVAPGRVRVRFPVSERDFPGFLDMYGKTPLPPYIEAKDRDVHADRIRYQTVYSRVAGSVAAPTAGLHFTDEVLAELEERGIDITRILLHVGPGTFVPVRTEDIRLHTMESECYEIPEEAANFLCKARSEKRRIIAVGTTSVRALESAAMPDGSIRSGKDTTRLFITPGAKFKVVEGMVTNFHLPGSTLLMLVCAFGGIEPVLAAYEKAVAMSYRFYSFGDSCLII